MKPGIVRDHRVSFIIVTHNDERTIEKCLKSIVNQDYPNIEILVVDACSRDYSVKLARKYYNKIIKLDDNILSRSRQIGVENASGDFLAIMDADVVLPRNWVSNAVKKFDKAGVGIVWSYNEPPQNSSVVARCFFNFWKAIMRDRIRRGAPFAGSNSLYLKKAIDEVGGFNKYSHYSEDVELAVRIQKLGYTVSILDEPIIHDTMYSLTKYTRNQLWAARDFSKHGLHVSGLTLRDIAYEHIYISALGFINGLFRERKFGWLLFPLLLIIRVLIYCIFFLRTLITRLFRS